MIVPNDKTADMGDILQIVRAEARKREHADNNPSVRSIIFVPECGVYVAVYEVPVVQKPGVGK